MKFFYTIIVFMGCANARCQIVRQPISRLYAGLGAYSKNFFDVFSATSNQASLAALKATAFGVYAERRFMVQDLNASTAIVAIPGRSGTIGFEADYFGSSSFSETQLGIIYARRITSQINVGVKFNYHLVRITGYSTASAINFEAGGIFKLTDKLFTGLHVYNPASSPLGKTSGEKLPFVYRSGFGYEVSERLFLGVEIVKSEDQPIKLNAGLQYNIHPAVFIRSGISTLNNSYVSIGLNVGFGRIDVDIAYHPQLGFTPGLLLLIKFKQSTAE